MTDAKQFATRGGKLLECPFCGAVPPNLISDFVPGTGCNRKFIRCLECHAQGPWSTKVINEESGWDCRRSVPSEIAPLSHTDHPLRHFDRTCDACVAEEVLTVLRDSGFHDAADFLLGKRVNVAAPSATPQNDVNAEAIAILTQRAGGELFIQNGEDIKVGTTFARVEEDGVRFKFSPKGAQ